MNRKNDIVRTLDQFLGDGPRAVSDHALQRALDAIDRTPQRHRRVPWRFLDMTPLARLASAAVVALLAIGGLLYVNAPRLGIGTPTPRPTASPMPPPAAAACRVKPVNTQLLASDCTYVTEILGTPASIAGTGHFIYRETGAGMTIAGTDRLTSGASLEIFPLAGTPSSPCADALSESPAPAPVTAAAYIGWLQASPLAGLPVTPVTIGGLSGQRIEVSAGSWGSASPSATPCDTIWLSLGEGRAYLNGGAFIYARINALDSAKGVIVIVEQYLEEVPSAMQALADQMAGIRFGP